MSSVNYKIDSTGFTTKYLNQTSYLWTLNNCKSKLDCFRCYRSNEFADQNRSVWALSLYQCSSDVEFLSLYLRLERCDKEEIHTKYKFSVINNKGEKTNTYRSQCVQLMQQYTSSGRDCFIKKDDILNDKNNLLCDDELKILCEIIVLDDFTTEFTIPKRKLYEDFTMIFETKKFSDVTLTVVDGRQFQAHKIILASNSPVFEAMFEHEMEETKHNNVNINDIDYEVLQEVLRFMYTGKIENLQYMAGEILAAADKYTLKALKVLCEKQLYENLTMENATEILVLADRYGAEQLKKNVIFFIYTNADVMKSKEWMELKQTHSHLFVDLFDLLARKNLLL